MLTQKQTIEIIKKVQITKLVMLKLKQFQKSIKQKSFKNFLTDAYLAVLI